MGKATLEWSARITAKPGAEIAEVPWVSVRTAFTPGELPLEEVVRLAAGRFAEELLLATGVAKASAAGVIESHRVFVQMDKVPNAQER